jgi:toxin ParE1/3/4
MKSRKIIWTPQSQKDLCEIRNFIARNAPITATAFIKRLRLSVSRLREFPETGQIVRETGNPIIREVLYGPYRIIYRIDTDRIFILAVFHSARLLDDTSF